MLGHAKGYIYKDEDRGTYYFLIKVKDEEGRTKPIKRRGFKTKKEARAKMEGMIREIEDRGNLNQTQMTVVGYLESYLENKKHSISKSTYDLYEMFIRVHIKPYFKKMELQKISPIKMEKYIAHLVNEKEINAPYVRQIIIFMSTAFKRAVHPHKFLHSNPVDGITMPKKSTKIHGVWNKEQIEKFLREGRCAISTYGKTTYEYHYYLASATSLLTGMRAGEILGLRWQDVDFEEKKIKISQTKKPYGEIKPNAKTDSSLRTITMPDLLVDLFLEQKERQLKNKRNYEQRDNNDLVITTKFGTPLCHSLTRKMFVRISKSLDLPIIRFHDLRHSHATLLLQQGINAKLIQDRLGHSDVKITLNIYSHVLPSMQREVADKLNDFFSN